MVRAVGRVVAPATDLFHAATSLPQRLAWDLKVVRSPRAEHATQSWATGVSSDDSTSTSFMTV